MNNQIMDSNYYSLPIDVGFSGYACMCVLDIDHAYLVIIGGRYIDSYGHYLDTIQILNMSSNEWMQDISSLNTPRAYPICETFNHSIFAIAGENPDFGNPYLDTVEVYNFDTNECNYITDRLSIPFIYGSAVVYQNEIVIFGGYAVEDHGGYWGLTRILVINAVTHEIYPVTSYIDIAMYETTAINVAGIIYLFGGDKYIGGALSSWRSIEPRTFSPTSAPSNTPSQAPTSAPSKAPSEDEKILYVIVAIVAIIFIGIIAWILFWFKKKSSNKVINDLNASLASLPENKQQNDDNPDLNTLDNDINAQKMVTYKAKSNNEIELVVDTKENQLETNDGQQHVIKEANNNRIGANTNNTDERHNEICNIETDEKVSESSISSFENQITQLLNIIKEHFNFMTTQEKTVNTMIADSGEQRNKLQNAKTKALETEKNLLTQITEISAINDFLKDIILIENLFNSQYSKEQKLKQESARNKYAENISIYEQKPKPICNIISFVDLLFQAYTDITAFKDWLKLLQSECDKQNIKMLSKPEAKQKNIERAFYKTFYVYAIKHGNKAHQQLTDVLRCSLVFQEFDDLYKCFAIIENLTEKDGGILRCKDRYNPMMMPFGYRDLLININCPKSNGMVICEVQLHHKLFYQHKKISHIMYKKARLFEKSGKNLAYEYANKYIRKIIGNSKYEYDDEKETESKEMKLLKQWKLDQYAQVLMNDEGYDDFEDWKDLGEEELKKIGFRPGHAKRFIKKSANL